MTADGSMTADHARVPGAVGGASSGRIPTLDGLRAVSILAVLVGHVAGTTGFPTQATAVIANPIVDIAYLGVRVFFVISGFLITGILVNEHRRSGGISLRRFYLRRTVRIFPASYTFILGVVVLSVVGLAHVTASDVVRAVTYTINYDNGRSWDVGHLWSMAVEEQFYLLWPITLALVGLSRGVKVALAVIVLAPVFRTVEYLALPDARPLIGNTFETTADAIAMGCVLALMLDRLVLRAWFRRVIESRWIIPALLLVGLTLNVRTNTGVVIGTTLTKPRGRPRRGPLCPAAERPCRAIPPTAAAGRHRRAELFDLPVVAAVPRSDRAGPDHHVPAQSRAGGGRRCRVVHARRTTMAAPASPTRGPVASRRRKRGLLTGTPRGDRRSDGIVHA